jgi:hypothetical protein
VLGMIEDKVFEKVVNEKCGGLAKSAVLFVEE